MFHAQLDAQGSAGTGVSRYQRSDGTGLDSGFIVQRVRPGFRGMIHDRLAYFALLEIGTANTAGPSQTFQFRGGIVDAWVAYNTGEEFAIQFGQMAVPFGLEASKFGPFFDFMEPSNTSFISANGLRDAGVMVQGLPGPFVYAVGLFNGEGSRRTPIDSQGDLDGRLAVRINRHGDNRFQIGVSGRYGGADPKSNFSDSPLIGLTTSRGYQFWNGNYLVNTGPTDTAITNTVVAPTAVTVLPAGTEREVGMDATLQLGDFDVQAEGAYVDLGRREASRTELDEDLTLRSGAMTGFTYYASAHYWLTKPTRTLRAVRWEPTTLTFAHHQPDEPEDVSFKTPSIAIMARWEQLLLDYDSTSRSPAGTTRGQLDFYTTRLHMDSLQVALSAWFTTRVKLQAQYGLYYFPGTEIAPNRINNQALAPGAVVQGERGTRPRSDIPADVSYGDPQYYSAPALDARFLHEFAARVQVTF